MPPVKSLSRISAKWIRVSSTAGKEYQEGIENPRADWAERTAAAEPAYEQGVQQAIQNKSFSKGVLRAGTAKWQKAAREKGPIRWQQGIAGAAAAYESGFAPYRKVIEALTLPPRGPKGSPENILRAAAIAKALHDEKLRLAAA